MTSELKEVRDGPFVDPRNVTMVERRKVCLVFLLISFLRQLHKSLKATCVATLLYVCCVYIVVVVVGFPLASRLVLVCIFVYAHLTLAKRIVTF